MTEVKPIEVVVRELIMNALKVHRFHADKAAKALGVDRRTLYRKLRLWGYTTEQLRELKSGAKAPVVEEAVNEQGN